MDLKFKIFVAGPLVTESDLSLQAFVTFFD